MTELYRLLHRIYFPSYIKVQSSPLFDTLIPPIVATAQILRRLSRRGWDSNPELLNVFIFFVIFIYPLFYLVLQIFLFIFVL